MAKRHLQYNDDTKRLLGPLSQTKAKLKAFFCAAALRTRDTALCVWRFICAVTEAVKSAVLRVKPARQTASGPSFGIVAFALPFKKKNSESQETRSQGRLSRATSKLRTTMRQRVYGREEIFAKCLVSGFAVLMGFTFLLICVYGIIPSVISNTAHYFENDIATEMYRRTLKDADTPAFRQTDVQQDISFPRDCFASVLKDNPDIVGRLTISGLDLGYLVTQYTDNVFYTTAGYNRKESDSGAIFLHYRCNAKLTPPKGHYIIYGKNVPSGSMFGKLWYFRDREFFYSNPTIRFDTLYGDYEWEVFSVYVAEPEYDFEESLFLTDSEWLEFLKMLKSNSLFETDIELRIDDTLLTLYTECGDFPGARLVVHARMISN